MRCRIVGLLGIFGDAELLRLSSLELVQIHELDDPGLPLEYLLLCAKLEDFGAAMKEALLRLSPDERVSILTATDLAPQPPELMEWLYAHWYESDRHLLEEKEDSWGRAHNLMTFRVPTASLVCEPSGPRRRPAVDGGGGGIQPAGRACSPDSDDLPGGPLE
ncbi:hypothetical protein [Hyalangium versicolor]|uniref:hypothetical protein n=1 Tax=Hyalangium versicolor TaxID=2861190 RepID=UPI001CCF2A95|nr:hypothetical protein [Hyalangium versicolor]